MELFAALDVQPQEEQQAIAHIMATRDKRWLGRAAGAKNASRQCSGDDTDNKELEQEDANAHIEALDEAMVATAVQTPTENEQAVPLTMQLIRETVLGAPSRLKQLQSAEEEEAEACRLLSKKVLRLDWLNIGKIENLDAFTHVQELYLQHNLLEEIEGLEDHSELSFLTLAGNRIREVKRLKHLQNLKFLDLSMNLIEDFDVAEFPASLRVLRLAGNPFERHMPAYASLFFERLPQLIQVDGFHRSSASSLASGSGLTAALSAQVSQPPSSVSSQSSDNSGAEYAASVAPLPTLNSPIDHYRELQMEVELPQYEQEQREKPSADKETAISQSDYEKQHGERMAKWKQQLTALTSRTKAQLEDFAAKPREAIEATSRFRTKRGQALARAREATDAALADAANHFQEMELAHQNWQQSQQRQPSLPSGN